MPWLLYIDERVLNVGLWLLTLALTKLISGHHGDAYSCPLTKCESEVPTPAQSATAVLGLALVRRSGVVVILLH